MHEDILISQKPRWTDILKKFGQPNIKWQMKNPYF